jgi:hypothetical protein
MNSGLVLVFRVAECPPNEFGITRLTFRIQLPFGSCLGSRGGTRWGSGRLTEFIECGNLPRDGLRPGRIRLGVQLPRWGAAGRSLPQKVTKRRSTVKHASAESHISGSSRPRSTPEAGEFPFPGFPHHGHVLAGAVRGSGHGPLFRGQGLTSWDGRAFRNKTDDS